MIKALRNGQDVELLGEAGAGGSRCAAAAGPATSGPNSSRWTATKAAPTPGPTPTEEPGDEPAGDGDGDGGHAPERPLGEVVAGEPAGGKRYAVAKTSGEYRDA